MFSPVRIVSDAAAAADGQLTLRNRQTFADLDGFCLHLRLETSDGLRVGVELELDEGFDHARWVGHGPWEN